MTFGLDVVILVMATLLGTAFAAIVLDGSVTAATVGGAPGPSCVTRFSAPSPEVATPS